MNFTNAQGIDVLVDRYNSNFSNMVEQLPSFGYLDGFSYHGFLAWGADDYGWLSGGVIEFGYDNRSRTHSAIFASSGLQFEEQVRFTINTGNLGLGIPLLIASDGLISVGARTNIGTLKVKTRYGREGEARDEEWEDLEKMLYMDFEINLKLVMQGFSIEPYYTFSADKLFDNMNDLYYMNSELNPDTYQMDGESIPLNAGAFGIRVMIALIVGE
jgi:hypothetical protein